ncbi:NAD(P)/FAD-dependent oxidoreductase [Pseudogemmobacter sonorensis]|uniref:NAD(P)/FAD-dependent oxidoreductase n=1 Tax=Pseudogemmobacter sonorensis TaxID=2989681 RepID=UPI00368EE1A2
MRIAVIGAGVIGATLALTLVRRGHEATLIDRSDGAEAAVTGNAGAFAFADVIPMATPGILRKAPLWLLDPDGPLSIPPAYLPRIAPWLARFWRASWRDRYAAAVAAQAALMALSQAALERLVVQEGLAPFLRREGQLQVYEGEAAFRSSLPGWEERRAAGVNFHLIESAAALAEIQPGLAPRFTHGGWTSGWINVTDPALWTRALAEKSGAARLRAQAAGLRIGHDGIAVDLGGDAPLFDRVVIAAGAWSGPLARSAGLSLPLETERGYNTTLPAGAFDLRTHLTFADHGFVVSKIGEGLRIGGAVELGGLKRAPRMSRAEVLLRKAAGFLPGLVTTGGRQWMGFRPSMPDSLPVIAAAPRDPRILLAFGHGHLGLTQSAGTAEIVADLLEERAPSIDIGPFRPTRFAGASR